MSVRVSLVLALRAKGEKHHTVQINIDNGVIAVNEATSFMSPFVDVFDTISKTHSWAPVQNYA